MRALALSSEAFTASVMVTSWPARANTCAMPWPMRPAPTTAMRAFAIASPRRVAAVGIEHVAGVEVRRFRREEQKRPRQVLRLAEPAFWYTGKETFAYRLRPFRVLIHPGGEWRAEDGRAERIHRDAGLTPFAAQCLGDAVYRRLRRAIGGVARRMPEQPARRRTQDHLATLALLEHLPAGGARHQPGLVDVGVHDLEII